jgi:hypothetical protein
VESVGKKVAATLLLGMIAAVLAGAMPASSLARTHSQGCPEHSRPVPSPAPASHSCCQAGHQTAIVREPANLQFSPVYSSPAFYPQSPVTSDVFQNLSRVAAFHDKPPGTLALRI